LVFGAQAGRPRRPTDPGLSRFLSKNLYWFDRANLEQNSTSKLLHSVTDSLWVKGLVGTKGTQLLVLQIITKEMDNASKNLNKSNIVSYTIL
jgi:hypothetical protein